MQIPLIAMAITEEKQRLNKGHQSHEEEKQQSIQHAGNLSITNNDTEALVTDGFLVPSLDTPSDEALPPAYGDQHDHVQFSQPGFDAGAEVTGVPLPAMCYMESIGTFRGRPRRRLMLTDGTTFS